MFENYSIFCLFRSYVLFCNKYIICAALSKNRSMPSRWKSLLELEDIKLHLKCISQRLDELEAMGISERDLFDSSAFQEEAEVKSIKNCCSSFWTNGILKFIFILWCSDWLGFTSNFSLLLRWVIFDCKLLHLYVLKMWEMTNCNSLWMMDLLN